MELDLLNLLAVLVVAWLAGLLASRFGYPAVLGELLAGIVLGPPLLGLLEGGEALAVIAEVGILLMMLYIGMEIDPGELGRASKGGLLAAVGGFITPFVLCYFMVVSFGYPPLAGVFVGLAAGVTSLATKSRILVDLHLLDTRIAHVMMAGALVADTVALVLFAVVLGVAEGGTVQVGDLVTVLTGAVGYFAVATLVGLKVLPWFGRKLERVPGRTAKFMAILLVMLVYAEGAHLVGMHGILGAFLAGLFLRESVLGRSLSQEIMHVVRDVSIGFLAPVFFVTAGFAVSLDVFGTDLGLLLGLVGLASVGKVVGTALFYLPTGHGWREGTTIGPRDERARRGRDHRRPDRPLDGADLAGPLLDPGLHGDCDDGSGAGDAEVGRGVAARARRARALEPGAGRDPLGRRRADGARPGARAPRGRRARRARR